MWFHIVHENEALCNLGHSPKYYPPISAMSYFAKIFSLQNFVSYGIITYTRLPICYSCKTGVVAFNQWHIVLNYIKLLNAYFQNTDIATVTFHPVK